LTPINELKRRNVFKVGAACVALAWVVPHPGGHRKGCVRTMTCTSTYDLSF